MCVSPCPTPPKFILSKCKRIDPGRSWDESQNMAPELGTQDKTAWVDFKDRGLESDVIKLSSQLGLPVQGQPVLVRRALVAEDAHCTASHALS